MVKYKFYSLEDMFIDWSNNNKYRGEIYIKNMDILMKKNMEYMLILNFG
jgi:hypothetical protein